VVGVLYTILFSVAATGFGRMLFGRWMRSLDVFAQLSLSGILGLGTIGLLTLPIGLMPDGLTWGKYLIALVVPIGFTVLLLKPFRGFFSRKASDKERLAAICIGLVLSVCTFFALVSVLAPSVGVDWDTVAYHLAVPKMWLQAGHIYPITFIHHSNFPQSVDNLYIWGLMWGGQSGAKAFQLCFYLLGILGVFGFTRQRYGSVAGGFGALAFATVPAVLWEAGTAYIDVAHGLFTGFGIIVAVLAMSQRKDERPSLWPIAGFCLGFAAGSKYTGLQALIATAVVLGGYAIYSKAPTAAKRVASIIGVAVLVSFVWYAKNIAWVNNPVYPFFYERFGGKNWSQFNADIYREQQQIFGIPRTGPLLGIGSFPSSVLGLAYEPGRYTDPAPTSGLGSPVGALGAVVLAAGMVWLFSGKVRRFEGLLLGWVGFSFLMWFVLSQQSRYGISFVPLLALLLGGGVVRLRAGPLLAGAAAVQAVATLWVLHASGFATQWQVVSGAVSQDDYLKRHEGFYQATTYLNDHGKTGKVALFDEVKGFYLDVPYFWANPGHTTEIGYDTLNDGAQFADRLKQMGFDRVYVAFSPDVPREKQYQVLGVTGPVVPYSADEKAALVGNMGQKYRWLLSDAVQKGRLVPEVAFRPGVIFQIKGP
jgi:hypothetical protein